MTPALRSPLPRHSIALLFILLLAFALRLGWGLRQPGADQLGALPDQVEYVQLARNLLDRHALFFYDERPNIQEQLWAYRTPGYPLFLAACGANVRLARGAQALIDTLTALAAYLLARRWLGRRAGLAAATLVAINPYLIYFSGLILSETLYTGMLAWGMVLLARRDGKLDGSQSGVIAGPSYSHAKVSPSLLLGLLILALAVLVRPSGLFLPMWMGAGAMLLNWAGPEAYQWSGAGNAPLGRGLGPAVLSMVGGAAVGALLTGLVLWPWAARNHRVLGQWIWTTTNGGITLYDGFNPHATGASDQTFLRQMPQVRYPRMREVERSAYFSALARRWALEHPARSLQLAAVKIARTWSPIPLSREYGGRWVYVLAGALFAVPLDILILLGLIGRRLTWRQKLFLVLPALYFTLVHGLSVGSLRYRMPMAGPMAVLAGCGLAMLLWRERNPGNTDAGGGH